MIARRPSGVSGAAGFASPHSQASTMFTMSVHLGANASINSATINQPIVGFIFGQAGLMYNLTLQGSKITKLQR